MADWADLSEGACLLRSNTSDWSDEQLWKAYVQLTSSRSGLYIQKDQRRVRPIWYQRADRVQAHILACFLAFVLWTNQGEIRICLSERDLLPPFRQRLITPEPRLTLPRCYRLRRS